jgi:hypothetical protein
MMRGDLADEAEGPRLMTALASLAGEPESAVGGGASIHDLPREQKRFAGLDQADGVEISDPHGVLAGQDLLQPGNALPNASRCRVRAPERCHGIRSKYCDVLAAESDRAFERTAPLTRRSI